MLGHSPWWGWLIACALAGLALAMGFLVPYTLYLNQQVTARFGELRWQIPTRVYARPLMLQPGMALDARTLKIELDAASYREDNHGELPGTYQQQNGRFTVSSRGYVDVDGAIPASRLIITLNNNQVSALRKADTRKPIRRGRLDPARIATLYGQKQEERRLVRLEEVPQLLVTGLQVVEDRDFKHHHGIDITSILRAAWVMVRSGGGVRQGASTLTQQLARSGLLGIGKEQTLQRKCNEILYALILEARYSKRVILESYLNQVYLGQRGSQAVHGVATGAEFWYGRELGSLTTEQVALLIGLVKGPSYYDPRRFPDRALSRRNFVLGKLHENKLIDDAEYMRAQASPLGVPKEPGLVAANRFVAYLDLVRRQLAHDYPENVLRGAGMTVLTGMSPSAQAYAERGVQTTLSALEKVKGLKRPPLQAGLVLTDVHNGDVLAVVGSRDATQSGFNRAIEAQRQVGSLLKPFVYLLALASPDRWSLSSWVEDTPVNIPLAHGRIWSPSNSDNISHGTVRLIDALAHSYNQATVRVGMQVGPERVAQLINVLAGLKADANPSLILGATDQSPYAMTQLYQFLASGVKSNRCTQCAAYSIRKTNCSNAMTIPRHLHSPATQSQPTSSALRYRKWSTAVPRGNSSSTAWVGCPLPAKPEPPTMDVTAGTRATPGTTWLSFGSATTKTSKLAYTAPPVPCAFGRASSRSYQAPDYKSTAKDWIGSQSSLWALAPQTQTAQAHAAFRL